MGNSNERGIREKYFAMVSSQKLAFLKKHKYLLKSKTAKSNWKSKILTLLDGACEDYPESTWPSALKDLLAAWHSRKDGTWSINALWFNFIQQHNYQVVTKDLHSSVTLSLALPSPTIFFEASSLSDFIKSHIKHSNEHLIGAFIFKFRQHIVYDVDEIKYFMDLCAEAIFYYYGKVISDLLANNSSQIFQIIAHYIFTPNLSVSLVNFLTEIEPEDLFMRKLEEYSCLKCEDFGIDEVFQLEEEGYSLPIEKLKEISHKPSPYDKLKVIYEMTKLLCQSIDDYWAARDPARTSELVVNGDQILGIFMFIVLKARVPRLKAQLKLVGQIGVIRVGDLSMDYYITTLEACVIHLSSLTPDLIEKFRLKP